MPASSALMLKAGKACLREGAKSRGSASSTAACSGSRGCSSIQVARRWVERGDTSRPVTPETDKSMIMQKSLFLYPPFPFPFPPPPPPPPVSVSFSFSFQLMLLQGVVSQTFLQNNKPTIMLTFLVIVPSLSVMSPLQFSSWPPLSSSNPVVVSQISLKGSLGA